MHARAPERTDAVLGIARRQEADQGLSLPQASDLGGRGRRHLHHDICGPRIAHGRTRFGVQLVRQQGALSRTTFYDDVHTLANQAGDRLRYQRDPALVLT
ncbi:Uncharacterised protein [Mycobacteroides abscessus subsp. massiliense]|nr:Uncharacterised protein [Mycobacteroides abscessus subsp. massiliense]